MNRLVEEFYKAALFLIERIEKDGWRWRTNYLREHVGCTSDLKFSNTKSPEIMRELLRTHPDLEKYLGGKRK